VKTTRIASTRARDGGRLIEQRQLLAYCVGGIFSELAAPYRRAHTRSHRRVPGDGLCRVVAEPLAAAQ